MVFEITKLQAAGRDLRLVIDDFNAEALGRGIYIADTILKIRKTRLHNV